MNIKINNIKISVIGSGTFGCALANLLAKKGYEIKLWGRQSENMNRLMENRRLEFSSNNIILEDNIAVTSDIEYAMLDTDIVLIVLPSIAVREICMKIKMYYNNQAVVVATKGFEDVTYKTMNEIVEEILVTDKVAVLSGPTHAEEVAKFMPSSCVIGAKDINMAKFLQDIFMSENFRVYRSDDVRGIELGGALKNIIALAAGISDGLGYGDNAKAAIITRGIVEITRLGVALGAKKETFSGLTGIGDLIVTCASKHSRNRKAGYLIGQGKTLDETLKEVGMVVEGVNALKAAYCKANELGIYTPIIDMVYAVLYNNLSVTNVANMLINKDKKEE